MLERFGHALMAQNEVLIPAEHLTSGHRLMGWTCGEGFNFVRTNRPFCVGDPPVVPYPMAAVGIIEREFDGVKQVALIGTVTIPVANRGRK